MGRLPGSFYKIPSNISGVKALCKLGHFNIVSKISQTLFELGT